MDKRYQVFVSSTYADLQQERQKVIQTLMEMDCIPAGMELFPAADDEQWEFIKRVIDDCDYYIVIIGGRYGTLTDEGISYTEMEYDYAISVGLKVLAFLHQQPDTIPVDKSDIDSTLRHKLNEFREKVAKNRLVKFWNDAAELPGLVALSLLKTIKVSPAIGWVRANVASDVLLVDLNDLRKENARLKATIAESESRFVPAGTNLAPLDDSISVNLEMSYQDHVTPAGKVTASWSEIFSRIAPDLEEHPSNGAVNAKLAASLYRRDHPSSSPRGHLKVQHDDFQTIRIQLSGLGLINTTRGNTLGGVALFWSLTKNGRRLMTELRGVKATRKESVAGTTQNNGEDGPLA